jgi:alpha-ketoglutarate-dependent taurine dioxygenase
MILVNKIDFISIDEIKSNPEKYKEIYLRDKIIVFRNANLTKEEQKDLMIFFGDTLNWYPNSKNPYAPDYIEDHHKHMLVGKDVGKDELMLAWHIEHVQDEENSHHGATWRMEKFDCPADSGHTYFVDMTKMFKDLNKKDQDFLSKCINKLETVTHTYVGEEKTDVTISKDFSCVNFHPITGEKTVRIWLFAQHSTSCSLSKIDNREPNEEEKARHKDLTQWIRNQVWENKDIRMVLKWEEGDLAVPDLYKLAHSVSGGFTKNQRTLSGQFGRALPFGPFQEALP